MNVTTVIPPNLQRHPWHEKLTRLGFVAEEKSFRLDGVVVRQSGGWMTLETNGEPPSESTQREPQDQLGLWKTILTSAGPRRLFEIPADLVVDEMDEEISSAESQSLESFVRWAMHSADNRIPKDWVFPARELVESWLPANALTAQIGAIVRQGKMILTPERWTLRFPILTSVPADLPEARTQWLRELVSDAQNQWRMIRFALIAESGNGAFVAEIDFTGAPHSTPLFLTGLDGLKHAVAWLVEPAEILADATVVSRALANGPNKKTN